MHNYIQISKINDFIFNPDSLYFHSVYESFDKTLYQTSDQTNGTTSHEKVDKKLYSSKKSILQGTPIVSNRLNVLGKLDIFDIKKGLLIERKHKIKKIYQGYLFQIYAQCICLEEAGYKVNALKFYSISDNKNYPIKYPNKTDLWLLNNIIEEMREYQVHADFVSISPQKAARCIYNPLFF